MKDIQTYIERIRTISLERGVVLSDEQALDVLTRMVGLVPAVMEKKPKALVWRKNYVESNSCK